MVIDSFWAFLIVSWPSVFAGGLVGVWISKLPVRKSILFCLLVSLPVAIVLAGLNSIALLLTGLPTRLELWPVQ